MPSALQAPHPPDPRAGTTELGSFRLLGRLGEGGFAEAYLAEQIGTDRHAVVKIAHRQLMRSQRAAQIRERFIDEVRACTRVQHPNLVTVYTSGDTSDGLPAIAMEFIPGDTLESYLHSEAPLSPQDLIYIPQLASALSAIHRHGVVHRDVTPGNIIISRDHLGQRRATLLDFGIAKVTGSRASSGEPAGTPRYVAPEQLLGHAVASSDMFSLGAVMWWALTGMPYLAHIDTVGALLNHQMNAEAAPNPRDIRPQLSAALARLTQDLLHPDARCRPTAEQLLARWPECTADLTAAHQDSGRGAPEPLSSSRGHRLRILVVEPNAVVRHMVGSYLKRLGCAVRLTADPRAATRAAADEYDVVALASRLPRVSVRGVIEHLREHFPDQQLLLLRAEQDSVTSEMARGTDLQVSIPGELNRLADHLRALCDGDNPTALNDLASASSRAISRGAVDHWRHRPASELDLAFDEFAGIIPELIARLDDTISHGLSQNARAACDDIELAADTLGASHLARLATTFRILADAGELANPRSYIEELEAEYARVFQALLKLKNRMTTNRHERSAW